MAIIITRQIEQAKNRKTNHDLNSILKEWKWGTQSFKNSQEFLTKMKPWINDQIKVKKELEEFLKKNNVKSLSEL